MQVDHNMEIIMHPQNKNEFKYSKRNMNQNNAHHPKSRNNLLQIKEHNRLKQHRRPLIAHIKEIIYYKIDYYYTYSKPIAYNIVNKATFTINEHYQRI